MKEYRYIRYSEIDEETLEGVLNLQNLFQEETGVLKFNQDDLIYYAKDSEYGVFGYIVISNLTDTSLEIVKAIVHTSYSKESTLYHLLASAMYDLPKDSELIYKILNSDFESVSFLSELHFKVVNCNDNGILTLKIKEKDV